MNNSHQFDVLVIGSGAAGLYTALCLPEHLRVGIITKDTMKTGASDWAQGGIAASIDGSDSPKLHWEDTLKAGSGLCDAEAVQFLVNNASEAIASLVNLGVTFDRQGDKLALTLEAAHSRPRVLHAADTTGKAIVATLIAKVLAKPNLEIFPQALALSLWLDEQHQRCQGIRLLYQNRIYWLKAKAVIIATGGGGQVFAQTTNPPVSTGDGVALAWRAGATIKDVEFVQFHPTALTVQGAPRFLISEAVRGEGAHLVDSQGDRFVFKYHPAGELAPRDVVSRAIYTHLQNNNLEKAQIYLDLSPIPPEKIRHRFPNIIKVCQRWGIDVFNEPIPVAPAAHYWMGGIATDLSSCTSIEGLYAVGETASTGVHGANRLASNSLLECLVFASQLSQLELTAVTSAAINIPEREISSDFTAVLTSIEAIRSSLPLLMWESAGICRTGASLEKAIAQVEIWRQELRTNPLSQYLLESFPQENLVFTSAEAESQIRLYAETFNLLDVGYLILKSAAFREESRGGHYRVDYPETLDAWQVHTLIQGERWFTAPLS
ncbi:L-aspartate oxidase [Gloeocapsa sp. PCC 73106]|uniref:L-aspartate oxidase n=1 Tax=Gloeocapsa sp. PCC 73106 TaxID=102232 RepID=UPI0002AC39C9|nr:L-aspartate oxidase [Gloeocapsa sp. PCC 73106]ELR96713.1 L-aspartate oxidase [Gloeocapsa sp. PCC 73106]